MEARNSWVDSAKGLGIILVVYGHVERGLSSAGLFKDAALFRLVDSIIYSFHMPLFFFLSGLFFYSSLLKRGRTGLVLNKVDSILYPYVLWSLIQGSVEVGLSHYTNGNTTVSEVLSLAWHPRAQFWFLYALFLVFALCSLVYAHVRRSYFFPVLLVFACLYVADQLLPQSLILEYLLKNSVFFAFGIWFNEIKSSIDTRRHVLAPLLGLLFCLGQYLFHFTWGHTYTDGGWPSLMLADLSIFFVVTLAMCLGTARFRWLQFLGASSMTIYLMHILVASGTRVVLQKLLGIHALGIHLLLGTTLGLMLPLVAHSMIRRYHLGILLEPPEWLSAECFRGRRSANAGV